MKIAIIPARGGSKGIPKKNLLVLGGRPLVDWSILAARESGEFAEIIVSSDDENILERARVLDVRPLKRPPEFSNDKATSESALLHALENSTVRNVELVAFLQPTSPLRLPSDLSNAFEHFRENNLDSLFSSVPVHDRFVWEERAGTFESLAYDWKNRQRRQEITERFLENGSFYIFKPNLLVETGNRLGGKIGTFVMDRWKGVQIDSPYDIEIAEIFIENKLKKEWPL
jgi:CMP-N,N'-diacetyllegionaminic acid synthase